MVVLVAACLKDPAAVNIAEKLINKHGFEATGRIYAGKPVFRRGDVILAYIGVDALYAETLDRDFKVEAVVFASRHESEGGKPSLTVHVPGNLTSMAEHGGKPKSLAWANPHMVRNALMELRSSVAKLALDRYAVSIEATHHGPTELSVPAMFVEIGSSISEWKDDLAGEAAAEAVLSASTKRASGLSAVGFGGGHYSRKHTDFVLGSEYAVGHCLPKYFFESFDLPVVNSAFRKTSGGCGTAIVDWKGVVGSARSTLIKALKEQDVEIVRI